MRIDVCLIAFNNSQRILTRWHRDICPALDPSWEIRKRVFDNSPQPSEELQKLFHYEWQEGKNCGVTAAVNHFCSTADADFILYVCGNHGKMIDPSWINDLIRPHTDDSVAMTGRLNATPTPQILQAKEFYGKGLPSIHIQGGVWLGKPMALRTNLVSNRYFSEGEDVIRSWKLLAEGWNLVNVPSICSVYREVVQQPLSIYKYIHDDSEYSRKR